MRISDWSSDVCSSDLRCHGGKFRRHNPHPADYQCRHGHRPSADQWRYFPGFRTNPLTRARRYPGCYRLFQEADFSPAPRQYRLLFPDLTAPEGESPAAIAASLPATGFAAGPGEGRSDEHTSELQSLINISYAVFFCKTKP